MLFILVNSTFLLVKYKVYLLIVPLGLRGKSQFNETVVSSTKVVDKF